MPVEQLENLVRIGKLQPEPPDQAEFDGMVESASLRLADASIPALSTTSRFSLIYGASHTASLAALRWHGYRAKERYIVFQCLIHTLDMSDEQCRLLSECHRIRNLAEYEGHADVNDKLLAELEIVAGELLALVKKLGRIEE